MPISNDVSVRPTSGDGGGGGDLVPEGVYNVEIKDITYIDPEQNPWGNKAQLKFRFQILTGEHSEKELVSWVTMTLNPGWESGSPSHLYKIATAVMGEEPDTDSEFYPNVLMGGVIQVVVEQKKAKSSGKLYAKISNYLKSSEIGTSKAEAKQTVEADDEEDEEVPF